jgi:inhibitor of cysteine peptidase
MKKNILSSLTLLAAIVIGCHNQEAASVKVADNSGTIETKIGEPFIIKLESNVTTGYSWRLAELEPGIVEKIGNVYKPTKTQDRIVGSGGIEEWTFKAVAKGKVTITLEYVRPWEKDVAPVHKAVYQVIVK